MHYCSSQHAFKLSLLFFSLFSFDSYAEIATPPIGVIIQPPQSQNPTPNIERAEIKSDASASNVQPLSEQRGIIFVKQIEFKHDLETVSDAELQNFIAPYLGKSYRLSEFKKITEQLEQWLANKQGLIKARVWIPLQEIQNQTVRLDITQGTVGKYQVSEKLSGTKSEQKLIELAQQYLASGAAITQTQLEQTAYRVIDYLRQPIQVVLLPTSQLGVYNVLLDVAQPLDATASITFDNTGSRYTSVFRDNTALTIYHPFSDADQLQLAGQWMNNYQRSWLLRYERPFLSGWRVGVEGQYSDYQLCCEFKPLDAEGQSIQASINAFYTIQRQREQSIWLGGRAKYWNGRNQQLNQKTSDRRLSSISLIGQGTWSDNTDQFLQLELTAGNADLSHQTADEALDQISADIADDYYKATLDYQVNYPFAPQQNLYLYAKGQWANKNLDSSEKISMGGLSAIRAYPYGEAMGDLGTVLQAEYRYQILPTLQTKAFYDVGYVRRNAQPWQIGLDNQYALQGAGLGLTWQPVPQAQLQLIGAAKLGSNAGRDSNGNDSDGRDSRVRGWIVGSWSF